MSTTTRVTVEQYHQMIADGVFDATDDGRRQRLELIEGELLAMSPIGWRHVNVVDLLMEWSFENLPPRKQWIRVQHPIGLAELESEPEPDIAWVKRKRYVGGHPTAADVLLIIEVADSSLAYDCGRKADLYAAAGIADYWVVNLIDDCLEIFRDPVGRQYRVRETLRAPVVAQPLALPQVALPLSILFSTEEPADSA